MPNFLWVRIFFFVVQYQDSGYSFLRYGDWLDGRTIEEKAEQEIRKLVRIVTRNRYPIERNLAAGPTSLT